MCIQCLIFANNIPSHRRLCSTIIYYLYFQCTQVSTTLHCNHFNILQVKFHLLPWCICFQNPCNVVIFLDRQKVYACMYAYGPLNTPSRNICVHILKYLLKHCWLHKYIYIYRHHVINVNQSKHLHLPFQPKAPWPAPGTPRSFLIPWGLWPQHPQQNALAWPYPTHVYL